MKTKVEKCANKGIKIARRFLGYLKRQDLAEDEIELVLRIIGVWLEKFQEFANAIL